LGWEVIQLVDHRSGTYRTPEEVTATVNRMMDVSDKLGFDGIDLDYEFQPPELREGFTSLMEQLGTRLKAQGKKLSICVGYYPHTHETPPNHGFIDAEAVGRVCDEVRIMCYDQYFGPAKGQEPFDRPDCQGIGPSSTQPWARNVMQHWLKYVPAEKLVMGLPAYSNDYVALAGGGGRHIYSSVPPANNWLTDKSWLWYDKINVYRYYDEKGEPHIFYANDEDSTRAHLETASDLNISTISFWQARSVSPGMWQASREWRSAQD
jgi:spore germination protein YaaH